MSRSLQSCLPTSLWHELAALYCFDESRISCEIHVGRQHSYRCSYKMILRRKHAVSTNPFKTERYSWPRQLAALFPFPAHAKNGKKNAVAKSPDSLADPLYTRNTCNHLTQNLLSSRLLFENINTKIQRTTILLLLYMGVELGLPHYGKNTGWRLILYVFHKIGNIQIRICSNLIQQCKKLEYVLIHIRWRCSRIGCWGKCFGPRLRNTSLEERSLWLLLLNMYNWGHQIDEEVIGGAHGT